LLVVLRLGHRPERDKRVTTHVCLTARAFGADAVLVDTPDPTLERTVAGVAERFGGTFSARTGVDWRRYLRSFQGTRVHLTMYGGRLDAALKRIPRRGDLLIVVGAEKVPRLVYDLADLNVAVGNQPHSEVAALAVFLERYTKGAWEKRRWRGRMSILPSRRGKRVRVSRK